MHQISNDHAETCAVNRAQARVVHVDRDHSRRLAMIWMVFAWIAGTICFEFAAHGAEFPNLDRNVDQQSEPAIALRWGHALDEDETKVCLSVSPLAGLFRVESNSQIRPTLDRVIRTETTRLALIESTKVIQLATKAIVVDEEVIGMDEIVQTMPLRNSEFRQAYQQLERNSEAVGLSARRRIRKAYNDAKFSSLPGLIRLTTYADPETFPPLYVEGLPFESAATVSIDANSTERSVASPASPASAVKTPSENSDEQVVAETTNATATAVAAATESSRAAKSTPQAVTSTKPATTGPGVANDSAATANQLRPLLMADAKIVRNRPVSLPAAASTVAPAKAANEGTTASTTTAASELAKATPPASQPVSHDIDSGSSPETPAHPSDRNLTAPVFVAGVAGEPASDQPPAVVVQAQPAAAPPASTPPTSTPPASTPPASATRVSERQSLAAASTTESVPQMPSAAALALPPLTHPATPEPAVSPEPIRQPDERIAANWPFTQPPIAQKAAGVSLNVDNADVRTVFEMLARGYGMNILVSPDVVGTVTANVEGLTAEQTLSGVLKMCDLRAQVDGEMIYIYPPDKLPADARSLRLFPLDFARSEVLEPIVQGLLSPIGNAYASTIDSQDNLKSQETIVVVDTPDSIKRIESYISQADQPPRQVMIEARVLEIELSDSIKHGVDIGAALGGDLSIGAIGIADPSTTGPLYFTAIDGSRVTALLDLLETTTDAKTLASPKVMVVNGQQAKIQVGQQLGFTVATVTQTSTIQDVQFLDTGVVLSVKPTISRDGKILMDVKPEVSNGQINPDTLLPEEETRELETSVMLNDHQGVVIGGLIQENDRTVIRKLPWLGDVKHVGKFFQHREAVRSRSEIIIALIPHIVHLDQMGGYQQPCLEQGSEIELERVETPLLQGQLQRVCRPWEARLPDSAGGGKHMDVNKINRMLP